MRLVCKTCDYVFVQNGRLKKDHQGHEFMLYRDYEREYTRLHNDPFIDGKMAAEMDYRKFRETGIPITRTQRIEQQEKIQASYNKTVNPVVQPKKKVPFWFRKIGE